MKKIYSFSDFCAALQDCGFSMGGGNSKGIFAIIPFSWNEQEFVDSPIRWHTGDPETDPWEWRMRVLEERQNVAYSKIFFKTSGYITRDWYPFFLSVRRNDLSFEEAYLEGIFSHAAKRIFDIIAQNEEVALHEIKQLGGFGKEDNTQFDRAITELQMKMFITMCGRTQKKNKYGEGYGWNSTVFCTTERFWQYRNVTMPSIPQDEAYQKIAEQVYKLNPDAQEKTIKKFILG